jgi:hypothetical protein
VTSIDDRPSGRHQLNIGHLVVGLAFLCIVGVWALVQTDTVNGDDIRWLMPIPWVVAGVAGLVATAVTGPKRYAVRQTGWVDNRPIEDQPELSDESEPEDETSVDETAPLYAQKQNDPEETP